jgi:hypothetical protein
VVRTRVLVAYGNEYRAYREAIAAGIRLLRPHTEVSTAAPADLGAELARFDPQVVVCGVPGSPDPDDRPAWVELPAGVGRRARVRVGDRRREAVGLSLEGLLVVGRQTMAPPSMKLPSRVTKDERQTQQKERVNEDPPHVYSTETPPPPR